MNSGLNSLTRIPSKFHDIHPVQFKVSKENSKDRDEQKINVNNKQYEDDISVDNEKKFRN